MALSPFAEIPVAPEFFFLFLGQTKELNCYCVCIVHRKPIILSLMLRLSITYRAYILHHHQKLLYTDSWNHNVIMKSHVENNILGNIGILTFNKKKLQDFQKFSGMYVNLS